MKGLLVVILISLLSSIVVFAEPPDTLWTRAFGGSGSEYGKSVLQTDDEGYIVLGYTDSFGAGGNDFYLIKTDSLGNTQWTRTYGGSGEDFGYSIQPTEDSGYIIAGNTSSFGAIVNDIYLLKIDSDGDTLWTKIFRGNDDDYCTGVRQTADGGYVLTGFSSSAGAGGYDVILLKTNSNGTMEWMQFYGGESSDYGYSVEQTSDEGYIIAGYSGSFTLYDYDGYLIKTDADGDTLWTRNYGGFDWDKFNCVQPTEGGGYILLGNTYSFGAGCYDVYLVKTDSDGDTLWTRTYGGEGDDTGLDIQQTTDGGYIITGTTRLMGDIWDDAYLIKTDENGDTLWTYIIGGVEDDKGNSVQLTTDGGYIIAGETSSFGAGGYDVWLIRLEAEGMLVPGSESRVPLDYLLHNPYPNPFNSSVKLTFTLPESNYLKLAVYDIAGREIGRILDGWNTAGRFETIFDASGLPSGLYFVDLMAGNFHQTRKLLLVK